MVTILSRGRWVKDVSPEMRLEFLYRNKLLNISVRPRQIDVHRVLTTLRRRYQPALLCITTIYWPLCGEFTGDRWIPRTNGQYFIACCIKSTPVLCKRQISHIPHCSCPISDAALFRTEICTFLFWMVHCGICDRCIVGFENLVYPRGPYIGQIFHYSIL